MNEHHSNEALPAIPAKELRHLTAIASLPTKSIPRPQYIEIWILTKELKSEMTLGERGASLSWAKLRNLLEAAALSGDFRAMDEFSKAWKAWGNPSASTPFTTPRLGFSVDIPGSCSAIPRRRKTLVVLEAIDDVQRRLSYETPPLKRAPTHKEIIERVGNLVGTAEGIDETELSRQLRCLGLQDRINPSRETS